MILKTSVFKEKCSTILMAIDSGAEITKLIETLELKTIDNILYLNVTNKEYYVSVRFELEEKEEFHATINAINFLKLITATTTETIELQLKDTYLIIKGNGTYKIPFIFENDKLLELPVININNVTSTMVIEGDILNSILQYNSKEISKLSKQPVQKLYYIDQQGCITFTNGACVNNFNLEKPIKLLLSNNIVKLFKLFKNESINFSLGYDSISSEIIQTKVMFETKNIKIVDITPSSDSLLANVPVTKIRALANKTYDNVLVLNKKAFLQSINRLLIFNSATDVVYGKFYCSKDNLIINNGENSENIKIENGSTYNYDYSMLINLATLKLILDSCETEYISLNCGDKTSISLKRDNIVSIVPEAYDNYLKEEYNE